MYRVVLLFSITTLLITCGILSACTPNARNPTENTDIDNESNQLQETKEVVLGDVTISVPSDWYIQTQTEDGQICRILVSEMNPQDEPFWIMEGIHEPREGPLIELSYAIHYVLSGEYSTSNIAGASVEIRIFQLLEGERNVKLYYLPASNVFVAVKYETPEEYELLGRIMSSLIVIESSESGT